jgi:methionyl-tRNA synthetase
MTEPRHILVAVAWPYASGSRHLGHLAGAYLPADIFARYHRLVGNRVLMVSGIDVHGTPITVRADQEGVSPQEIVDRYHAEFLENWEKVGIQWELYTSTGTDNHRAVTQDVFSRSSPKTATSLPRPASSSSIPRPGASSPTATWRAPARTAGTDRRGATSATAADASSTRST